jgi:ligand-binding sensor domain-containing protein
MVNYFGNKLKLFSSGVITFLLVVLGLSASYSLAASELNFRTVSATNSLSQSSVLCMVQDSTGFLWIGTKDGLNRFDGYEFVTYKYDINDPNTLSNNEISCLALEGDQFLWIGTRSGGINRLQLSTGLITRFDNLTYDDLIRDLYFDQEGRLWAGTSEGLFEFVKGDDAADDRFINRSRT